jgi:glutamate N-acetyltransferase/amino-acid N-acetyltransferase
MIGPDMATLLAVVMTDARLSSEQAHAALRDATNESFNCISVDGHTSTNDTALLLASGKASGKALSAAALESFRQALTELCQELAKMIPDDGEGATHLIEMQVEGCANKDDADRIARTVAASPLVKCAVAGGDPNWGRIVSAAGYAGVPFDPKKIRLEINGLAIFGDGGPLPFDAKTVSTSMKENRLTRLRLVFGEGSAAARFWASDLNEEYVRFNSEYST